MGDVQAHDYGSMPFGAHDEADRLDRKAKKERKMARDRADSVTRLQRPEIGCSPEEADRLVDVIGVDTIKAESDEALATRVSDARDQVEADAYDPGEHNVDDVEAYAADHPDELAAILEAEQTGKGRVTLIAALEKLSAPADVQSDPGNGDDATSRSGDPNLGPHVEAESPHDGPDAGAAS